MLLYNRLNTSFIPYFNHIVSRRISVLNNVRCVSATSDVVIGIDLGTTNSCVAVIKDVTRDGETARVPYVIENAEGKRTTPSYVAFNDEGECLVGELAQRQAQINPERTFYATKRLIGRRFGDSETKEDQTMVSYQIVAADNGDAWVTDGQKKFSPSQIGGFVLRKMKETAESHLNKTVKRAVVTVPAYFNDAQRTATKDAGKIAGLEVERIINEPTAAAVAYGFGKSGSGAKKTIAVFDLGGGTFDISILDIEDDVFSVLSTNGDTFLGGEDIDNRILNFLIKRFKAKEGINLQQDASAKQRLREAAEKAKCELSFSLNASVELPYVTITKTGPKHLSEKISRAALEDMVDDILERTRNPCTMALEDAKLTPKDIDEVLLVGGMTRMPKVQEIVKDIFGQDPVKSVNPDEAVAIGAAVQGGVLSGHVSDMLLLDVTPLSLGLETNGGIFSRLINRGTTIPANKSQLFSTAVDNQTVVDVKIYQGEREVAPANKLLGNFLLDGIPPAPRGIPQIEVTFDIDVDGILTVSAVDKATGTKKDIVVKGSSGLTEAEIQKMAKDGEAMKADDMKRKEVIEARNNAEQILFTTERELGKHRDKLSKDEADAIDAKVQNLKSVLDKEDSNAITSASATLSEASYKLIAKAMEVEKGSEAGTQQEKVKEAEVVDDKEKSK